MLRRLQQRFRGTVRDAAVTVAATIAMGLVMAEYDAFERLYDFSRAHEAWELDEVITTLLLSPLFLSWFAFRRWRDSREAGRDQLTDLPNRKLLERHLGNAIIDAHQSKHRIAVLMIDLDGFKHVNDALGHEAGDKLLQQLAQRMRQEIRRHDIVGRRGGDEFVALLTGGDQDQDYLSAVERIQQCCSSVIDIDGNEVNISASIGVTFYPQPDDGEIAPEQLLRQADHALYEAKLAGKNRFAIFDVANAHHLRSVHLQRERFRQAIKQDELRLYYQPQLNMRTGQVLGVEALVRWQHPERGLLFPGEFLQLCHDHPINVQLGEWVIANALAQLHQWQQQQQLLPISINIAPIHLQQSNFVERLEHHLNRYPNLPNNMLQLEIVETDALSNLEQLADTVSRCQQLGVDFALDDFGTGHSSLAHLRLLPTKLIKIDRGFVAGLLSNRNDRLLVESIITLAKAFSLPVLAEGVENEAQRHALLQLGCETAQGYLYSQALPPQEFMAWLQQQNQSQNQSQAV